MPPGTRAIGKSVMRATESWCVWQVPARMFRTLPGWGARTMRQTRKYPGSPAPAGFSVAAPFPQDRWIYFLADYRKRDRPAPPLG
jgi:hypothetical protein